MIILKTQKKFGCGFLKDCQSDLTLSKVNFPEITLCYVNQGQVSLVKGGEQAIYLEYVVCGQIIPLANPDPSINLDIHKFEDNQVLLYVPYVCMVFMVV